MSGVGIYSRKTKNEENGCTIPKMSIALGNVSPHSYLKESTGLDAAVLTAWKLVVIRAVTSAKAAESKNVHIPMLI